MYHDFYDSATLLNALLEDAAPAVRSGELFEADEWASVRTELASVLSQFRHTLNGVYLFGGDDVRKAAEGVEAMMYGGADLELMVALRRGKATLQKESMLTALSVMIEPWESGLAEATSGSRSRNCSTRCAKTYARLADGFEQPGREAETEAQAAPRGRALRLRLSFLSCQRPSRSRDSGRSSCCSLRPRRSRIPLAGSAGGNGNAARRNRGDGCSTRASGGHAARRCLARSGARRSR